MKLSNHRGTGFRIMRMLLEKYVDALFEGLPDSTDNSILKSQIRSKCFLEYDRCIKKGMPEAASYAEAVKSVSELKIAVDDSKADQLAKMDKGFFAADSGYSSGSALTTLFSGMSDKDRKTLRIAATSVMWLLTVVVYLLISFITELWDYTWLIFLGAAALGNALGLAEKMYQLKTYYLDDKAYKKLYKKINAEVSSLMWLLVVITYFIVSFFTGLWDITWIIFLVASAAQIVLSTALKLGSRR